MLDFIRRQTQGGFGKVFMTVSMGVLIVSFGIWGIGDIFRGRPDMSVAKVGKTKISAYEFTQAFQRQLTQIREATGQEFDADKAKALGLDKRVLSDLVNIRLFDLAAQDLGISASDDLIAQQIKAIDQLKGPNGQFDRGKFDRVLQAAKLTEQQFIALMKSDLVRKQLVEAMLGGLEIPNSIVRPIVDFNGEARLVRYVVLPPEATGAVPAPTEEEIKARYESSKGNYLTPEFRKLTFVAIDPGAIAKTIHVSDADIRARYDQHKVDYETPEKRVLEQLIYQDEAEAQAATKSGKSFADLAKDKNKTPDDIAFGEKKKSELSPKIADAVFAAAPGTVVGPLKGDFGWTLVHIVKVTAGISPSFESLTAKISAEIATDRATDQVQKLSTAFEDKRAAGSTIEVAAMAVGLAAITIPATDPQGQDPQGLKIPQLAERAALLANAFKARQGDDGELLQSPDGGYYVVRVDSVTPPAIRALQSIRETLSADINAEKRNAALNKIAEDLTAKARAGTSLDDIGHSLGRAVLKETLRRGTDTNLFSPQAVGQVFLAQKGQFLHAPVKTGNGVVVMQLDGIEKPTDQQAEAAAPQFKKRIADIVSDEIVINYAADLQRRYGVTVNDTAAKDALGGS